jgi:hypothetical protein
MKNKIKYLLLIIPLFLFFLFYQKTEKGLSKNKLTGEKNPVQLDLVKDSKDNQINDFKRQIIYLSPANKKIISFINKKNERWLDLAQDNLLKFQEPSTKVKIVPLEGVIFSKYGKAQLAEKILVSYINQNGLISSFNAYVDSETGRMIGLPWNKTVVENKNIPRIQASGIIKQIKKDKQAETK